jgi:hypothetical protein
MLLFALVYIYAIRDKQIRFLVLFLFLYDFIFYQNMVVFSNQSAIMLTFICIYANAKMMRAVSDSPTRQRNLSFT